MSTYDWHKIATINPADVDYDVIFKDVDYDSEHNEPLDVWVNRAYADPDVPDVPAVVLDDGDESILTFTREQFSQLAEAIVTASMIFDLLDEVDTVLANADTPPLTLREMFEQAIREKQEAA